MSLRLVETLSLPGGQTNEDAFAASPDAALVLDGATPLGPSLLPGPSDAAWIAQFGARRLMAHLKDGDAPRDALAHALADAQKSFSGLARGGVAEKWQTPCAAMMLAAETPAGVEFLWYGDCAALVAQGETVTMIGPAMGARMREGARARLLSQETKKAATDREAFLPLLRASRGRINSGSHWLFSPDARAASHVSHRTEILAPGALVLLASDGFLALASDYDAYDLPGLMAAAKKKGLAALGVELRAIESADPDGEKFARFKKSDDATALLLEIV